MSEDWKKYKDKKDQKEFFCPACISIPLAFVGVGVSAYGASGSKKSHKKQKKIALLIGIITIIISIFIIIYFLWISKCENCR